jgi:hypothetical protein
MGTSAGGYLAAMSGYCVAAAQILDLCLRLRRHHRRLVLQAGPVLSAEALITEQQAFRPNAGADLYLYCRQNGLWPKVVTGHDPATEPKWFKPYCPVQNVTREYPPTFSPARRQGHRRALSTIGVDGKGIESQRRRARLYTIRALGTASRR